jgi:acetyl-CoA C-acetyltransferase
VDLQRACGTGLEAAALIANKISTGQIDVGIAGGSDTNSDVPLTFKKSFKDKFFNLQKSKGFIGKLSAGAKIRPSDFVPDVPTVNEPRTGLSMGQHCELMAKEWQITREEQDQLAFESQQSAHKAYESGFYSDLVVEFEGQRKDQFVRPDTSLEKLATLKPAFDKENGTLTAGNSTPLTDGAAITLLCSEDYAKKMGWEIQAYFEDFQYSAVDFINDEGLLMAPTHAVASLITRQNMSLQDFDFYEIHEAFAAQALANMKAWESDEYCQKRLGFSNALGSIDRKKLNIHGGSLALGHPFAATGARLIATMSKTLKDKESGKGLLSLCTAGGMGVAAIISKP